MKTRQLIDRQHVLNLATAAKIVIYAPVDDDKDKPAKGQLSLLNNGTK